MMKNYLDKKLIQLKVLQQTGEKVKVKFGLLSERGVLIAIVRWFDFHFLIESDDLIDRVHAYDTIVEEVDKMIKKEKAK